MNLTRDELNNYAYDTSRVYLYLVYLVNPVNLHKNRVKVNIYVDFTVYSVIILASSAIIFSYHYEHRTKKHL